MAEQRIKEEYYKTIQESGFLCGIPEIEQKNAVRGLQIRIREYKEEELIFLEGEEIKEIAILHSGTVRGEKFHMEGAVDLMYIYKHGEIFGAEAPVSRMKTSPLTYMANEKAEVIFIDFQSAIQTEYASRIALGLLQILADDNIKKLYKIEALSKRGQNYDLFEDYQQQSWWVRILHPYGSGTVCPVFMRQPERIVI